MKIEELDTPVLMVNAAALERNIERMERMTSAAGISYRPHAKTHKSAKVAKMQIDAGAIGVCCAKLAEAEVLANEGVDNILITTPVVGESKISRLMAARNMAKDYCRSRQCRQHQYARWYDATGRHRTGCVNRG